MVWLDHQNQIRTRGIFTSQLWVHEPFIKSVNDVSSYYCFITGLASLWRHNDRDGVSNHQPRDCLLNRLFRRRSKKTSKLRVTGLCEGNSPMTGEFPTQRASNLENVSISWHHHGTCHKINFEEMPVLSLFLKQFLSPPSSITQRPIFQS